MGKGKGKKGGSKKSKQKTTAPSVSHGFYQGQINSQANALGQIRDVYDEEVVKYDEVAALGAQIEQDKGDITSYLHRMVREKELDIDLLNETEKTIIDKDQISTLENNLSDNLKVHKLAKNDAEIEKLKLVGRLNEMSETSHDKRKIEGQIEGHKNTLSEESDTFTEQLYQKEKKSIQKHDSIKLEMVSKVKQLTSDFHKLSAAQVSKISKGAIRKNQILGQSLYQSDVVAHESISRNHDYETKLNRVLLDTKAYESSTPGNENAPTGTISAFRRENAVRTKKLQDLVVEYRDIEDRIESLDEREGDLIAIQTQIDQINRVRKNRTDLSLDMLRNDTSRLLSEADQMERVLRDREDELENMFDIGNRILRDLQVGSLSRLTAKLLLDSTKLEIKSKIAEDIRHHYAPGAIKLVPG